MAEQIDTVVQTGTTEPIDTLKALITGTDIDRYAGNDTVLDYALSYAESEILKRRNATVLEDQYLNNQIEGAKYYLSRIGAEGYKSTAENGVTITWKNVPDWLQSVVQRLGVIK
jgi:hypothetical protein